MGQLIWVNEKGWCSLMSASKINHYFEQDEVDKESFPVTLCGKMTTADIHQEDSKNKRCKVCERKLEKLS